MFPLRPVPGKAGGRFLPTLQEVKDWSTDLDDPARKKAEGYIRELSSGVIDVRTRATARLKQITVDPKTVVLLQK